MNDELEVEVVDLGDATVETRQVGPKIREDNPAGELGYL